MTDGSRNFEHHQRHDTQRNGWPAVALLLAALLLVGCGGPQSTLAPGGVGAQQIATLFWWMLGGAVLIWLLVMGIALYTMRMKRPSHDARKARWLIIGGGAIFPSLLLGALLVGGLLLLPSLIGGDKPVGLKVAVSGEQWWWRVRYEHQGRVVELANEIRLPVGETVAFTLSSPDVIHSFWIPSLGGKVDMIPGRKTRLVLTPTRKGLYRGACAEYCGSSHALMNFQVVVMEPEAFHRWLAEQAQPAALPATPSANRGKAAFLSNGCGACHTVRGTSAAGSLGPDLTHVGSRLTLGAGMLPTEPANFARWTGHTQSLKPGVKMPSFGMLGEEELQDIAAYLAHLK